MLAVPRIATGVNTRPVETPHGLRYHLTPSRRGAGTIVPARTLAVLLLMDGTRTIAEIHRQIRALGAKMPDPASAIDMVRLLEAAGIVEVEHHFTSVAPIRHRCLRCGRSCEGHLVGPITDQESQELESHLAELRGMDPSLPPGPATVDVMYEAKTHRVLSFPGGRCIFLNDDRLCRLHERWGVTSKPLPCRMFPLRMLRTESGTRVVQSPRCYMAHRTYRNEPESTAANLLDEWAVWRPPALIVSLDPDSSESLSDTAASLENRDCEETLLALLQRPELDLGRLLRALADRDVQREPRQIGPGQEGAATAPRSPLPTPRPQAKARFGEAVFEHMVQVLDTCFDTSETQSLSRFGNDLRSLVLALEELDGHALSPWDDLGLEVWSFVRFCLVNHVFSRGTMVFGSVKAGVLAFCMGVMAARWLCPAGTLDEGPSDLFVQHQTTWLRVVSSPEIQSSLFPGDDTCDGLLALLAEG